MKMEMKSGMLCSLHSLVKETLQTRSTNTALIFDNFLSKDVITYKALSKIIHHISSELSVYCNEGDYICIDINSTDKSLYAFLSVILIKAVACPLSISKDTKKSLQLCYKHGFKFIIIEKQMLETDSGMRSLVTLQEVNVHPLKTLENMALLEIPCGRIDKEHNPNGIEFMISSSGSTGLPKAIRVPGKCIVPNILSLSNIFNIKNKDVIFLSSPLTFDASVVQIFLSLAAGSTLLIVPNELKIQPSRLLEILFTRNKTTLLQATPSLVFQLGEALWTKQLTFSDTSLRILCLGAEPFLSKKVVRKFLGTSSEIELFNLYGISEVSSWATIERISLPLLLENDMDNCRTAYSSTHVETDEWKANEIVSKSVPIGSPLTDTTVELRKDGKTIDDGMGEIWIGGKDRVCLIDDETDVVPYKMRPSGDIGLKVNGKLYYAGRKDHRVKIHGQFIDLESIEKSVEELDEVRSCVCIGRQTSAGTFSSFALYVFPSKGIHKGNARTSILRTVSTTFPEANVICDIAFVDSIPVNSHGKKDRLALQEETSKELWDLDSPIEKVLLSLFEHSINNGKECFTPYDREKNLVDNGGDSFAAVFLENKIQDFISTLCTGNVQHESLYDGILTQSFNDFFESFTHKFALFEKYHDFTIQEKKIDMLRPETHEEVVRNNQRTLEIGSRIRIIPDAQVLTSVEISRKRHASLEADDFGFTKKIGPNGSFLENPCEKSKVQSQSTGEGDTVSKFAHGCYCAGSRGGRFVTCECCSGAGLTLSCPSVANNVVNCGIFNFKKRWQFDTKKCVDASPLVVCNGDHSSCIVYIGSHSHRFFAVNGNNGVLIWKVELGDRIESSAALSKCGTKIIVGCYDHHLYVISRSHGTILWKYSTGDSIKCSPIVNHSSGFVYIGSHDHHLYALDIDNRLEVWKISCGGGSLFSSPALSADSETLYICTLSGRFLAILAEKGCVAWTFCVNKPIFSSPVCSDDFICLCCVDGKIYLLSKNGKLLWSFETNGPIFSSPCIHKEEKRIFVGSHDAHLYCLSFDGHLIWKAQMNSPIYATPVYAFRFEWSSLDVSSKEVSSRAIIIACSTKGVLCVIDFIDGGIINSYYFPNEIFSSPVISGNNIFIGCRDDNVYCLELT